MYRLFFFEILGSNSKTPVYYSVYSVKQVKLLLKGKTEFLFLEELGS